MSAKSRSTLFVGGFDDQVTREILYRAFLPFGEIADVEIPTDPRQSEGHRGFGFVEFVESADAQAALDNMHMSELYGRTIKVTMAKPMRHREFRDRPIWEDEEWLQWHAESKQAANEAEGTADSSAVKEQPLQPVKISTPAQEV
ncbi:peptidyl-prolyl cis-trans isomerase E-like protein [Syncephalis fuscata]|nr:peptidyl-prolyl cis-trans isomerase E-like protein [Syncephalis fuscata]